MLEVIVFAVTLVVAQFVSTLIMLKYVMKKFMNKQFIKEYTKMGIDVAQELTEEMEDDF